MPPRLFGFKGQLWTTVRALAATTMIALLGLCLSGKPAPLATAYCILLAGRHFACVLVTAQSGRKFKPLRSLRQQQIGMG
jgi:hypothetical protein